jgi:hypothetical protein
MPGRTAARSRPPVWFIVLCAAALLSPAVARGQTDDVLPNGGMDALYADRKKHHELADDLIRGLRVADSKEISHVEALDFQAKFVTFPFTWPPVQQQPGAIAKAYGGGIENDVKTLLKSGHSAAPAIAIYAPKVIEHALEVLKTRRLVARVNAARVLAKLAELGPPELSDALVATLEDPAQNDAVKYYIIHGLRVLANQQPPVMSAERETKAAEALAKFIDHNMTIADTTTREEVDGFRFIRREAVRALAQFRNPAVAANGQAAIMLLRVVAKDDLMPPPRIDERVEAAIGVARYKSANDKYYQPDYAIAQIGLFLDDFNLEYTAEKRNRDENRGPLILPWKVMSSRLYDAIDQMRLDVGDHPYVIKVAGECLKLLEKLEKEIPADATDILTAVGKPPAHQLFKNIDSSTVKAANRRDLREQIPPLPPQLEGRPPGDFPPPPPGADAKPGAKPDAKPSNPFAPKPDAKPDAPPAPAGGSKPAPPPAKGDAKPAPPPPAPPPADAKPPAGKQ